MNYIILGIILGVILILHGLFAIKNKWINLGPTGSFVKRKYINRSKFFPGMANFGSDWMHKGREAVIIGYVLLIIGILFIATSTLLVFTN